MAVGRLVGKVCRLTRVGGGTTLPGRVVGWLAPGLLARRTAALQEGVVLVSGTNGKTTTAAMIHAMLEAQGVPTVWNRSGANMAGGVTTAVLHPPLGARAAVLEVDEAALPDIVERTRPRVLVLTNIFRDQLDRFAEPERVAALLHEGAMRMPERGVVVANADDLMLWGAIADRRPVGFGATLPPGTKHSAAPDQEPSTCPECSADLVAGHRTPCSSCGWSGARPDVVARVVARAGLRAMVFELGGQVVTLPVGGVHNVYNAAAAFTAATAIGVRPGTAVAALELFTPRFGRAEEFRLGDRRLWLGLIKNPAGAGALLRALAEDPEIGALIVSVNDQDADGRDVSWIWDADFERLAGLRLPVVAAGRRADDVALRLKYAGLTDIGSERDELAAISAARRRCPSGRTVVVLATYTAMLAIRRALLHDRARRVEDVPA